MCFFFLGYTGRGPAAVDSGYSFLDSGIVVFLSLSPKETEAIRFSVPLRTEHLFVGTATLFNAGVGAAVAPVVALPWVDPDLPLLSLSVTVIVRPLGL